MRFSNIVNTKPHKVDFTFFIFKKHEIKSTDCQCLNLLVERFKVTLTILFRQSKAKTL